MLDLQEVSLYRTQDHLNPPHGGELVNLFAAPERVSELQLQVAALALVGSDRTSTLRPRFADEWWDFHRCAVS